MYLFTSAFLSLDFEKHMMNDECLILKMFEETHNFGIPRSESVLFNVISSLQASL